MMSEWKKVSVSDLGRIVTGKTPKTAISEYYGGCIPFLTPSDDMSVKYVLSTSKTITEDGKNSVKNAVIPKNSICVSCIGSDLGKVVITTKETVTNQQINSVIVNTELYDVDFVYYAMVILGKVLNYHSKTSTAVPIVNKSTFSQYEILCPVLSEQRKIARILSEIDSKIAINTAINEKLEQQAQAILKEYMDKYHYTLMPLSIIAEVIDCLHSKKPERVNDSNRQLLQLENIKDNGFLDLSYQFMISESDYNNWTRKCEIHEGDCVITNVGRIGAVAQAPRDTNVAMGRNMTCIRLKPKYRIPSFLITILLSEHMKREIRYNTDEGTIMGALNVKNIPKLQFPFFEENVFYELESLLSPIRKQFEENSLQNQRLAALRDTLLPKLMNGEIDVSAVKI